jgi:hypothetical protein
MATQTKTRKRPSNQQIAARASRAAPKPPNAPKPAVNQRIGQRLQQTRQQAPGQAYGAVKQQVSGPHTGALIAEYILGVFFIFWAVFTSKDTYTNSMSNALWRMSALTMLFFFLALVDHGGKSGKIAVAFGGMIDLAIIFTATSQNVISSMAKVVTGEGAGGGIDLTSALTQAGGSTEPPHELS